MSNTQGQGVWQWITSGFGEMPATHAGNGFAAEAQGPSTGPAIDFPLRYPGQVHDVETGLFYNHHRYYDPYLTVGYTQTDPIGLEGGWNRFAYAGANPLSNADADGLCYGPLMSACVRILVRSPWVQSAATAITAMAWSFVNGEIAVATAVPSTVSRLTPITRAVHEGFETGAYCVPKHFVGTEKPWPSGATPNSKYTHITKDGLALQNAIYDRYGKVIGHVDFKNHGGAPSGHGHRFSIPGDPFSGHRRKGPHIPYNELPRGWTDLPSGIIPATPIGK